MTKRILFLLVFVPIVAQAQLYRFMASPIPATSAGVPSDYGRNLGTAYARWDSVFGRYGKFGTIYADSAILGGATSAWFDADLYAPGNAGIGSSLFMGIPSSIYGATRFYGANNTYYAAIQRDTSYTANPTFLWPILGTGNYRIATINGGQTFTSGTWQGTSIDTAYTNAVSRITATLPIVATAVAKGWNLSGGGMLTGFDTTRYARLDLANTFAQAQTLLKLQGSAGTDFNIHHTENNRIVRLAGGSTSTTGGLLILFGPNATSSTIMDSGSVVISPSRRPIKQAVGFAMLQAAGTANDYIYFLADSATDGPMIYNGISGTGTGTANGALFFGDSLYHGETLVMDGSRNLLNLGTVNGFTLASMSAVDSTTYHGSASINTLGTITTGTWNAGALTTSGDLTLNGNNILADGAITMYENFTVRDTASAVSTLSIGHTGSALGRLEIAQDTTNDMGYIGFAGTQTGTLRFYTAGTGAAQVLNLNPTTLFGGAALVGILGNTASTTKLGRQGRPFESLYALGVYDTTTASAANVVVEATGRLVRSTSSIKYKRDVEPVSIASLLRFDLVSPVRYTSRTDGRQYFGFIAEDLHRAGLPELVTYHNGLPDGVQYGHITAILWAEIRQLKSHIKGLESRIEAMEARQ